MYLDSYYYRCLLALKSIRRQPWISAQVILTIAFGISASFATISAFTSVGGLHPGRRWANFYHPQVEPRPREAISAGSHLPDALTLSDARALLAHAPKGRGFLTARNWLPIVGSAPQSTSAKMAMTRATTANFFHLLHSKFMFGTGWSPADEAQDRRYVVISDDLNNNLFGGINSVGKTVRIATQPFTVIGVLENPDSEPRFYDADERMLGKTVDVYVPFATWLTLPQDYGYGSMSCWGPHKAEDQDHNPWSDSCSWVELWINLNLSESGAYREFLKGYALQQKRAGRFWLDSGVKLSNAEDWLQYKRAVPDAVKLQSLVALSLLILCVVSASGLQAVLFRNRFGEIAIRRALGASRRDILWQLLSESCLTGAIGGVAGITLGIFEVAILRRLPQSYAHLFSADPAIAVYAFLAALAGAFLATLWPAYSAARYAPVEHLRIS
jgi:putative ABC transport system permease protein